MHTLVSLILLLHASFHTHAHQAKAEWSRFRAACATAATLGTLGEKPLKQCRMVWVVRH